MKYIKGLDTIRAFAVLTVIFWHWFPQYEIHSIKGIIQHNFIPTGNFGVTLFFVLSGFLITSILLKAKNESKDNLGVIKNFVIRRSLRILPIYYVLIIFLLLVNFPFQKGHLPYFLTYTSNFLVFKEGNWNNFSHTWSLAVEEQFYLIWPWLIMFIPLSYLRYVFYFSILIGIASMLVTIGIFHKNMASVLTTSCFDAFGIGGLYAYSRLSESRRMRFIKLLNIAAPIALIVYFIWKIMPYFNFFPKGIFFERTIDSIISIGIIHLVIHNKNSWVQKNILENKWLNNIGKISYGIYLFHYPLPYFFNSLKEMLIRKIPFLEIFLNNYFISNSLMLILLFLIAYLSFELFEKRITSLKNKFTLRGTFTQ